MEENDTKGGSLNKRKENKGKRQIRVLCLRTEHEENNEIELRKEMQY